MCRLCVPAHICIPYIYVPAEMCIPDICIPDICIPDICIPDSQTAAPRFLLLGRTAAEPDLRS